MINFLLLVCVLIFLGALVVIAFIARDMYEDYLLYGEFYFDYDLIPCIFALCVPSCLILLILSN